jgi:hypothetical protein
MRRSGAQSLAGPSTWLEELPIRHQPFYLGEAKRYVGPLGPRIRELRIGREFLKTLCACPFFGGADEGGPDALAPHVGVNIPTFQKGYGAGLARFSHGASADLRESGQTRTSATAARDYQHSGIGPCEPNVHVCELGHGVWVRP